MQDIINYKDYPFRLLIAEDDDSDAFIFQIIFHKQYPSGIFLRVKDGKELLEYLTKKRPISK